MDLKALFTNLTKRQKIAIFVFAQLLVIVCIIFVVFGLKKGEQQHLAFEETNEWIDLDIPDDSKDFIADNVWQIVQNNLKGADIDKINDAVIRDGTYNEKENADGTIAISFLVDIDSLKQTYVVNTGWDSNKSELYDIVVDCPPLNQMKYKETVCYGAYYNTYSPELYLPYSETSVVSDAEGQTIEAGNYYITADSYNKEINIRVSICDVEKYKAEALKYLESTPIKLSEYTINYEVNDINVYCEGAD